MNGTPERWIVVPRWDEFQHRDMARSKVPPWVKNWTRLMSDDDYLGLSFHLRGILHAIWLEYARSTRQLSGSTVALSRRLGHRVTTRDLESLNHAGFIAFSASKPASNVAGKPASLDGEGDRYTPPTPPSRGERRHRNGTPDDRPHGCQRCKLTFRSQAKLDEHVYISHDGPLPAHYAAVEAIAGQ